MVVPKHMLKSYYPRLLRRNHNFYVRVAIPRKLWYLSKKKEIRYSLHTSNYSEALFSMRCESIKADFFIEVLKDLDMRKSNGYLVLDDADIEKLLFYRFKEIENFCEKNKYAIQRKDLSADDITLFNQKALHSWYNKLYPPDAPDAFENPPIDEWRFIRETIKSKIIEYLKYIKYTEDLPDKIMALIDEALEGKLNPSPVLYHSPIPEIKPQLPTAYSELNKLDKYAEKLVNATADDVELPTPKKYQPYWEAIKLERAEALLSATTTKTKWSDAAVGWLKEKQIESNNTIKEATLREYTFYLDVIFKFLEKEYVEDIKKEDIKKVSFDFYTVPKYSKQKLKNVSSIKDILVARKDPTALTSKTVQQYLIAFKSFMIYLKKEDIIKDSFSENFVIPKINREKPQKEAFTEKELLLIFNPKYYPYSMDANKYPLFWLPILALYTGNRIGELAQLNVDDIKLDKKIPFINISRENDNSLKTTASCREIPIHPDLIELGFIDFVKSQKKKKYKKLFHTLTKDKNNHNGYGNAVGKWFNERYLVWLGIKTPSKSFHSFRYNLKQSLRPLKLPIETVNAILGWSREGIGESIYGGIIPASEIYPDYIKLQYPFLKKRLLELAKRTDTHYMMSRKKVREILGEK